MKREPLDRGFNVAVLNIAKCLFPTGFDVSDAAPTNYEELVAYLNAGNRMTVWRGGSELTIYADPEVNHAFRAWHDWCHWTGKQDLTPEGERHVFQIQCHHLVELYGDGKRLKAWLKLLAAEVIGQGKYFERHKRFPHDQHAFVSAYLDDREDALLWPLW